MAGTEIFAHPVHLGLGATAETEPCFTGSIDWYTGYNGPEARLVSMYTFKESWDIWEMHPRGCEVVLCIAGAITLHQEHPDGSRQAITLSPGLYAINKPGTWHTADIEQEATALFITAGLGTQHRPRVFAPSG